ncbi:MULTISPECIES: GNAT family N-acetyltransferase [unclassified Oceanobacillus]|uniref:GNAT family N-acetyltransferase n=1 Tax=unclassified Oceanobacillus TaxID=2630292 RepID=UPI0012EC0DC3|nr:GNAT family N-acetyltransferase [Oceanobacillus sp. AG]
MQIRTIQAKDNKKIEAIIKQSLESENLNIPGTAYFDPHLGELYQFYQTEPNANYWVVVDENDEVLGGIGIGPFGNHVGVAELQKLYLAPVAQGRGFAKKLMQTALEFASKHYTQCYLETFKSLSAANHLYEKFGFVKLKKPLSGSEHNACDCWYLKEL